MAILEARVDADFLEVLRLFSVAARETDVPWLVVGATARILLLENVYGWPAGLGTQDVDFAVLVGDWNHYEALCAQLFEQPGVEANKRPAKRFRTKRGFLFDLLPYGGVEENDKQVFWPPDRDYLMTVRGFAGAARDAVNIRVNGELDVSVASPAGLCALKLFAWEERHAQEIGRDAKDIAYLFRNIERWLPAESLFEDRLVELEDAEYDARLAALDILGQQVSFLLENGERVFLKELMENEVEQHTDGQLLRDLQRYLAPDEPSRIADMLTAFLRGLKRE